MPVSSIGEVMWGVQARFSAGGAPSIASFGAINASGDRVAWVIRAPKAGTLHSFEFAIQTVGNNPDNGLRLSFQDVSTTTGFPDTSVDQYRDFTGTAGTISAGWVTPTGPLTSDGTDNGTKRTVVAGELIACVVDFVNFAASDSVTIRSGFQTSGQGGNSYVVDGSGGSYVAKGTNTLPIIALKYADDTYGVSQSFGVATGITSEAFASNSTPDEKGLKFQVSASLVTNGAWFFGSADQDFQLVLYNSAGTAIGTATVDKDQMYNGTAQMYHLLHFAEGPITLEQGMDYRIVLKPTTTTATTNLYSMDIPSGLAVTHPMGVAGTLTRTHRTDAGSWTDTATNLPIMGLLLSGIFTSSGGGGNSGGAPMYYYEG